jgi:hypothetical protein
VPEETAAVGSILGGDPTNGSNIDQVTADGEFRMRFAKSQTATSSRVPPDCSDEALRLISERPQISEINLSNCEKLTANGLKNLVTMPNLKKLFLSDSRLNTKDVLSEKDSNDVLNELTGPSTLVSLTLKQSMVDKNGLVSLSKMTSLKKLDLDQCPLIDDQAVAELSNLDSLLKLKLDHDPRVTNQVGKQLRKFKKLRYIELFDTLADDQTLKDISTMPLTYVDVRKCPHVSKDAATDFRKNHPKCELRVQ